MSKWLDIFSSYMTIQDIKQILPQISQDDINDGLNILIDSLSQGILLNENILRDISEIIHLFYKYDGLPDINTLFDVDNINVNILENFKIRGLLIDTITQIYDIELDDDTIEQWTNIKGINIKDETLNNKRLLQYLKYCSKFLSKFQKKKLTKIADFPNELKGLIGQYTIERYENKWLDDNWHKFQNKSKILKYPNAIDFIKEHMRTFYKGMNFIIKLARNTNPQAFEIIKDYCFNKHIYNIKSNLEVFLKNIARNHSDGAMDFLIKYWHFFINISNFEFLYRVNELTLDVFWNILAQNPNDKAINFFIEKCDSKYKWDILSKNKNSKVIAIIDENIKNMTILQKWEVWYYSYHYFYKIIDLLLNNWGIYQEKFANDNIKFLKYIYTRLSYYQTKFVKYHNSQKSLTDNVLAKIDLFNYNISKIIELLRQKWDIIVKDNIFWNNLAQIQNDDVINLLKDKWSEVLKTEEFFENLACNTNTQALNLLKDTFLKDNFLSNEVLNDEFLTNLALNSNGNAIELLKEQWGNIDNDDLILSIVKNLASNKNSQAIEFLKQIKNSITNFNNNWSIWSGLLKNPNEEAISLIIDNWNMIIMNWGHNKKFWMSIFVNTNDKLIDFLDVQCQRLTNNLRHHLIYLLGNKNKKAIRLFEKLISIYWTRLTFTKTMSINYLKNPNIFDIVNISLDNEYVKLLN
jgi:hypothetical protein